MGHHRQEIKTLPYATQLRKDVLPNIYELANVSSSDVITFTTLTHLIWNLMRQLIRTKEPMALNMTST